MIALENERVARIVGGQEAEVNQIPWQVGLAQIDFIDWIFCGGTIIGPSTIITAAHCVRDWKYNNCKANKVDLYFGLDQDDNASQVKRFRLEGRDFTVPNLYRKPMDPFDIAWIDMKMYFDGKSANGLPIDWCLNDLPSPGLIKAKVPDSDTGIHGTFSISGNL